MNSAYKAYLNEMVKAYGDALPDYVGSHKQDTLDTIMQFLGWVSDVSETAEREGLPKEPDIDSYALSYGQYITDSVHVDLLHSIINLELEAMGEHDLDAHEVLRRTAAEENMDEEEFVSWLMDVWARDRSEAIDWSEISLFDGLSAAFDRTCGYSLSYLLDDLRVKVSRERHNTSPSL